MFQDFAKRKFRDYISMLEFPAGRITFEKIWSSPLPPFIISFLENYIPSHNKPIDKKEFEDVLDKAIIFNINYIIKPKSTLLKFLFGGKETRPAAYIQNRLKYFQFYGYYITNIEDFIAANSPEFVSYNQIEHLLNEVNRSLYSEISGQNKTAHRVNLVRLLYYFFHDLGDNNPINIKLPSKILSSYFADKGFTEIKKKIDGFFSDEIFIQEAVELIDPENKKLPKEAIYDEDTEAQIKSLISKAREDFISKESSDLEIGRILNTDEPVSEDFPEINIRLIRQQEAEDSADIRSQNKDAEVITIPKTALDSEEIYSDDLLFASQFSEIVPPVQPTGEELRKRLIEDLFCESSYRKKIIKRLFGKNEEEFNLQVNKILDTENWQKASEVIEGIFTDKKVKLYSEEAVKFVDIFQTHFTGGK